MDSKQDSEHDYGCDYDQDLSPLSYARLYHLALDHEAEPLPLSDLVFVPDEEASDNHLASIDVPIYINTTEHLTVDKATALLLADTTGTRSIDIDAALNSLVDIRRAKQLRVECPLLRTDHEMDVRAFAEWETHGDRLGEMKVREGSLPQEPLDVEGDQGMEWPERCKGLANEIVRGLEGERIVVRREEVLFFQSCVIDDWKEEDGKMVWDVAVSYKRNTALEPVTPPLLPSSPVTGPYIPSSPGCHLPLLSDPPSLMSDDIRAAEERIFMGEALEPPLTQDRAELISSDDTFEEDDQVRARSAFDPSIYLQSDEAVPNPPHIKFASNKVEVPITPHKLVAAPSSLKSVTWNETVEEIEEMLLDVSSSDDGASELYVQNALKPMVAVAEDVKRRSEQEQLQEADSKARVEVPKMNFSLPDAPSKDLQFLQSYPAELLCAQIKLVLRVKEEFGWSSHWPGSNHLALNWLPIPPEVAKVALYEKFGEEQDLDFFLNDTAPVNDSSSLVWKPQGLRILRIEEEDDGDDEELELGHFKENQPQDVASLVRKRKMQFDEEKRVIANKSRILEVDHATVTSKRTKALQASSKTPFGIVAKLTKPSGALGNAAPREIPKQPTNFLLGGAPFSAGAALDNFLEIRLSKKQKPVKSAYFTEAEQIASLPHQSSFLENAEDQGTSIPAIQTINKPLVAPPLNPPTIPVQCIMSSTLLQRRTLMRTLQSLLPTLDCIERNFSAHDTIMWQPNSITRSPILSPLASEADLIISPSTALILTTLPKIRQKPLPGQKTSYTNAAQERIGKASIRYESLVVIVSEGNTSIPETTDGLDEQSSLAYFEFCGFCGALETPTIVHFATGGETNLARWVASVLVKKQTVGMAPLLGEETQWELFLRRAGMNAFAAQVVLAELRAPEGVDEASQISARTFGLSAFVRMGSEERARRFGILLGGTRVLEMVGKVVDMEW